MPLTVAEHNQLAVLYLRRSFQHERQGEPALAACCWNLSNDHCNAAVRRLNEEPEEQNPAGRARDQGSLAAL